MYSLNTARISASSSTTSTVCGAACLEMACSFELTGARPCGGDADRRHRQPEGGANAESALDCDRGARLLLHEGSNDGEPNPCPLRFGSVKRRPDLGEGVWRNARARVCDLHDDRRAATIALISLERHLPTTGVHHGLHRIRDEIDEDLHERASVADYFRQHGRHLNADGDLMLPGFVGEHFARR